MTITANRERRSSARKIDAHQHLHTRPRPQPSRFLMTSIILLIIAYVGCAQRVEDDTASESVASRNATATAAGPKSASTGNGFLPSQKQSAEKPTQVSAQPTAEPTAAKPSPQSASTQEIPKQDSETDAFARLELAKRFVPQQAQAAQLAQAGKMVEAKRIFEQIIAEAPFLPNARYNYACLLALNNEKDQALKQLSAAVENGFTDVAIIEQDNDLVSLRSHPEYQVILNRAKQIASSDNFVSVPKPAVVENQIANIGPEQAVFDARFNMVRTAVDWSKKPEFKGDLPIVGDDEAATLLRKWFAEGTAAGNWGDLYDNCDRNHSKLKHDQFPTLTRLTYDKAIRKSIPYGLQTVLLHNGVVIGNSSTASTGNPLWRSNTRYAYCNASSVQRLHNQYRTNHIYVYPDHTDYGLQHGDVFPANTPYLFTSRGSSGSDQPILKACVCALAALRPEVKQKLVQEGLIAPTLQWLVRQSLQIEKGDSDYLSNRRHEPVITGKDIDLVRLVQLAHDLQLDSIPPLVKLRVEEEDQGVPGQDFFDFADRTKLFDTPQAIARVYRTLDSSTRIVVSAEESADVNGYPLKFEWVVLNADPKTVEIKPLNANGSRVEITVPYTPKRRIYRGEKRETARLDIGVFAHNGKSYSVPAYVTYYTLANERREYDAKGRILSVTYSGGDEAGENKKGGKSKIPYADPMIDAPKSWHDFYHYTPDGKLLGWTRTIDGRGEEYTRDGYLVKETDSQGRPTQAVAVRYFPIPLNPSPMIRLGYEPTTETKTYKYAGPDDLLGTVQ